MPGASPSGRSKDMVGLTNDMCASTFDKAGWDCSRLTLCVAVLSLLQEWVSPYRISFVDVAAMRPHKIILQRS